MCECCVSSYGSRKGKAASCLQKVHTNNPHGGLRSGRETPFSRLSFFFPISTHTDFSKTCFSEARTQKARCTTRPPSPGLEHVRIIYMPEFYVFNVSMKHRQCEREPGPDMLSVKRYVCCSSIFVCCVKASIEAKGDVCISEKINCISFQYIPLYILVSVYFLFIVDKRTQAAPRPAS